MRAYETSSEALAFFERSYLEGRLWRAWLGSLLLVPFDASYILVRVVQAGSGPVAEWLAAGLAASVFLGIGGCLLFVQRPRLVRELAAFKSDDVGA